MLPLPLRPENQDLHDALRHNRVWLYQFTPVEGGTDLTLTITNFPTEAIYRHLVFYWNVTLELLKKIIETQNNS